MNEFNGGHLECDDPISGETETSILICAPEGKFTLEQVITAIDRRQNEIGRWFNGEKHGPICQRGLDKLVYGGRMTHEGKFYEVIPKA